MATLSYNYIASNCFSLSAFLTYNRHNRPAVTVYEPYSEKRTIMLRSVDNVGSLETWRFGTDFSIRLFNGRFLIEGNVGGYAGIRNTVSYQKEVRPQFSLSARYILNDWYISAFYNYRNYTVASSVTEIYPELYGISAGWSKGNVNVRLHLTNIFDKSYGGIKRKYISQRMMICAISESVDYHFRASVSASFCFSYGKKQEIEQNPQTHTLKSGILKY